MPRSPRLERICGPPKRFRHDGEVDSRQKMPRKVTPKATLDATPKATLDATQSDAILLAEPLPEIAFEGALLLLSENNLPSRACSARSNDDPGRCGSGVSMDPNEVEEIVNSFLRTASSVDADASVSHLSSADSGPARADSGPVRALTLQDFY